MITKGNSRIYMQVKSCRIRKVVRVCSIKHSMWDYDPLLHEIKPTWLDREIVGRCLGHCDTLLDVCRDPTPPKSLLTGLHAQVCKVHLRHLSRSFSVTAYYLDCSYVQYVLLFPAMSRVSAYRFPWSFGKWPVAGLKLSQ